MRVPKWGALRWLPIALSMFQTPVLAQEGRVGGAGGSHNVTLHINPRWRECSFQLDASLTQSAFRTFAGEAGVVTYFRPLSDARPMGRGKFEMSVLQWTTGIDDESPQWNDTFVHPDSTHWLIEGDGLAFPGLMFRAGVSERADVGIYITKSPGANYGFVGGQVQYNLVDDETRNWSAATRASFVSMYGPKDLGFTVYGLDVVASRRYAVLGKRAFVSPYAGVSTSLSHAREKSAVVDLDDEFVFGAHGTVGAVAQFAKARVALEYGITRLPTFSIKVGVGARSN